MEPLCSEAGELQIGLLEPSLHVTAWQTGQTHKTATDCIHINQLNMCHFSLYKIIIIMMIIMLMIMKMFHVV